MKKNKKKVLASGGKLINIDTPSEMLHKMQLATQQAKAESTIDPNVMGLSFLGNILKNTGFNMASKGVNQVEDPNNITKFFQNNLDGVNGVTNVMQSLAFGGSVVPTKGKKTIKKESTQYSKADLDYLAKINKELGSDFTMEGAKNIFDFPDTVSELNQIDFGPYGHAFSSKGYTENMGKTSANAIPIDITNYRYSEADEVFDKIRDLNPGLNLKFKKSYATGGNIPVEIEGEEIVETPNGQVFEAKGPSHEQGGIDMFLPGNTEVFSKRLRGKDGNTMADRKKNRLKKVSKIEKQLEETPGDKLLKKTLKRTKEANEAQEKVDMEEMNFFQKLFQNTQSFSTGGKIKGNKVYSGLQYDDIQEKLSAYLNHINGNVDLNNRDSVKQLQENLGVKNLDGYFGKDTYNALLNQRAPKAKNISASTSGYNIHGQPNIKSDAPDPLMRKPVYNIYAPKLGYDYGDNNLNYSLYNKDIIPDSPSTDKKDLNIRDLFGNITFGDSTALIGDLVSSFGPYKNTMEERAGDTINKNHFKQYGQDGLEVLNDSKKYIEQQKANALSEMELSKQGALNRGRNSSRSINTNRALDIATEQASNRGKNQVLDTFSRQMMQLLGQEAQLENMQDNIVMQGEERADIANRQDRSNFYSQLARDIATMGTGLQKTGKDINQIKTRNVSEKALNDLYSDHKINAYTGDIAFIPKEYLDVSEKWRDIPHDKRRRLNEMERMEGVKYDPKLGYWIDRKGKEINIENI